MTAESVNRISGQYPDCSDNSTDDFLSGNASDCYLSSCDQYRVDIAITLSLLVGIILVGK